MKNQTATLEKNVKTKNTPQSEKSIFNYLLDKEVPFSVVVSQSTFIQKGSNASSLEYFIVVLRKDFTKKALKDKNFKVSQDYTNVYERNLSAKEVSKFKKKINLFEKIMHGKEGRVYELKNNSFKKAHSIVICNEKINQCTKDLQYIETLKTQKTAEIIIDRGAQNNSKITLEFMLQSKEDKKLLTEMLQPLVKNLTAELTASRIALNKIEKS